VTEIGFIGLGNMGLPMAINLKSAGHRVVGYDPSDTACADAVAARIEIADSAPEAAKGRAIIITMLPNGDIVKSVYSEIVPAATPGACLIDCSTIDVDSARAAHDQAKAAGLLSLDAPVSGGVGGATAGTLTFMVGGSDDAFQAGKPAFGIMGQKAVHCGAAGTGQAAKICNNMLLGISMIGTCETFVLADKLGLDRQALFDVLSTSSGSCWSVNTYCPAPGIGPQSPADNDYRPGFAAALMLKDLKLSQQAADASGAPTVLGAAARDIYEKFVEAGGGEKDFSAMIVELSKRAKGA